MPTVKGNGITMYYEIHGEGKPLVLIMGLASDLTMWTTSVDEFAKKFKVITFDNRGVGRTEKPEEPYSIGQMANDTLGLMDALGIPKAHIIGLSMGGQIAQVLASRYPERVDSLVLVATSSRYTPDDPDRSGFMIRLMRFTLGFSLVRKIFARYPATKASAMRQIDALLAFDSRPWLGSITVPVLVVNGKQDKSIPVNEAELFTRGIPGARLSLFDGDHLAIGKNPELWYRPALEFLTGNRRK